MNAIKKLEQKVTKIEQVTKPTSTSTYYLKVTQVPTSSQSNASNVDTHETIPWWKVLPKPSASHVNNIRLKSSFNAGKT